MKQNIVPVRANPTGGLVEKKKQAAAAGEADEPEEAMREAARPVENMMNKRMKQNIVPVRANPTGGLVEKKKQAAGCTADGDTCTTSQECCNFPETGCWTANADVIPMIMNTPVKEEAKAVPLALDADPSQSTDEQAVVVGSRWSLAYNFGDFTITSLLRLLIKSNANHFILIYLYREKGQLLTSW